MDWDIRGLRLGRVGSNPTNHRTDTGGALWAIDQKPTNMIYRASGERYNNESIQQYELLLVSLGSPKRSVFVQLPQGDSEPLRTVLTI